jgi:hypothetical protein
MFGYLAGVTSNIQMQIDAIIAGTSFRGAYDASTNLFPATGGSGGGGAVEAGNYWVISVAGTLGGTPVNPGDTLLSYVDAPGQTPSNWTINANGVASVFGRSGVVTAQAGDYTIAQITNGLSDSLLSGNIFVGNILNIATSVTPSGELLMNNAGVFTLDNAAVINKLLTGFTAGAGTVSAADSILQAIQKIVGNIPVYSVVHKSANYQFLASEITVIMDSDAKTGTLPAAASVIVGVTYTLKMGTGATTGILAVPVGESLDGTLDGTFVINGADNSASAQSDGASWFTV